MDREVVGVVFLEWLQWLPHPQLLDVPIYPNLSIYLSVYLQA